MNRSPIFSKPVSVSAFTLLEVMIAMSIMVIAFGAILTVESNAILGMTRVKEMHTVARLAQNQMIETEFELSGQGFDEPQSEKTGQFSEPYTDYRWKRTIRSLAFPSLAQLFQEEDGLDSNTELLIQKLTDLFSQAIQEVTVTISWEKSKGQQTFSLTTYRVNFQHAFP